MENSLLLPRLPLKLLKLPVLSFPICEMGAVMTSHLSGPFRMK